MGLEVELLLGVVGLAMKFAPKVISEHRPKENGINLSHSVPVSLCPSGPRPSQYWDKCCILLSSDPMILGRLGPDRPFVTS